MIKISEGQCGTCGHFGAGGDQPALVQIRIKGEAEPDHVEPCGHPDNAPRELKVSPVSTCAGYTPAAA